MSINFTGSSIAGWRELSAILAARETPPTRDAWQELLQRTLLTWLRDPSLVEDDGIEPSSSKAILRALAWADLMKRRGIAAPSRIVPEPNGGVVLELESGDTLETIWIEDLRTTYCRYEGTKLVEHQSWDESQIPSPR